MKKMGNHWFLCIASFVLVVVTMNRRTMVAEATKVFRVGSDGGWIEPASSNSTVYRDWASNHRFHIGDSLNFEYKEGDSVLVVDKWSYYHCNTSNPIAEFTNGNSTFILDRPGPFYFISGAENHCRNGQRLVVDVIHPKSPPSFANPPEGYPLNSPTSSPSSAAQLSSPLGLALTAAVGAFGALSVGAIAMSY